MFHWVDEKSIVTKGLTENSFKIQETKITLLPCLFDTLPYTKILVFPATQSNSYSVTINL